jgi:hypothetical protein
LGKDVTARRRLERTWGRKERDKEEEERGEKNIDK